MMRVLYVILASIVVALFFIPQVSSAAVKVCDGDPNLELNSSGVCVFKQKPITGVDCAGADKNAFVCVGSASSLMLVVMNYAFGISGMLAVIVIVYAGYLYMTSSGVDAETAKAKSIAYNAVLGLVVMILSWTLVQIATRFLVTRSF